MPAYEIIIETTALSDLRGILRYITQTLKEPATAQRIYNSIRKQLMTLEDMPLRHALVRDEGFAARELRKMPVENYFAFYVVDETKNEVHVLRILYSRREWRDLL